MGKITLLLIDDHKLIPGGSRPKGSFVNIGEYGSWWSSTEYDTGSAWGRYLGYGDGGVDRVNYSKVEGFSVRCLRD